MLCPILHQQQENTLGQKFVVDAVLWADIAKSGHTDSLEDTLDYRKVYR
jgi:dihydroneopterin aldolase